MAARVVQKCMHCLVWGRVHNSMPSRHVKSLALTLTLRHLLPANYLLADTMLSSCESFSFNHASSLKSDRPREMIMSAVRLRGQRQECRPPRVREGRAPWNRTRTQNNHYIHHIPERSLSLPSVLLDLMGSRRRGRPR